MKVKDFLKKEIEEFFTKYQFTDEREGFFKEEFENQEIGENTIQVITKYLQNGWEFFGLGNNCIVLEDTINHITIQLSDGAIEEILNEPRKYLLRFTVAILEHSHSSVSGYESEKDRLEHIKTLAENDTGININKLNLHKFAENPEHLNILKKFDFNEIFKVLDLKQYMTFEVAFCQEGLTRKDITLNKDENIFWDKYKWEEFHFEEQEGKN